MLVIGLTGGIGTGKSTVSDFLVKNTNWSLVDADVIAREVVSVGTPAYKQILAAFQSLDELIVGEDGELDRARLGKLVFGNEERLKTLNGIVHPAVRRAIFKRIAYNWLTGIPVTILDVPLLFEAGLDRICGITVVVSTSPELQLQRLMQRNSLAREDAEKRIGSQQPLAEKCAKADYVLENLTNLEELESKVKTFVEKVRPYQITTLLQWIPPFGVLAAGVSLSGLWPRKYGVRI